MGIPISSPRSAPKISPYEDALETAFLDLTQARMQAKARREELERDVGRVRELVRLIRMLLELLPPERRDAYRDQLENLPPPVVTTGREGPLHTNIINLFARTDRREWKPAVVQQELAKSGIEADTKDIADVLRYLLRAGKIRKIHRGHYLVDGAVFMTAADVPGADVSGYRISENDE